MESSPTDHKETTILGIPAVIRERDKPTTPSPVMRPLPVSQALRTMSSALSFKSRISPDVRKPLSSPLGAKAIAHGTPNPLKSSTKP